MTYTARHVSRTATNPNLLFDRLHCLLRQLFTLVEFHEQHNAFVFLIFSHLTNYEAVHYPLNVVMTRSGGWAREARVEDIVDLGGPEPNATRVPKSSKDQNPAISTFIRGGKEAMTSNGEFGDRRESKIVNSQYPITPAEHHKASSIAHSRFGYQYVISMVFWKEPQITRIIRMGQWERSQRKSRIRAQTTNSRTKTIGNGSGDDCDTQACQ